MSAAHTDIVFGDEARGYLLEGLRLASDAVGCTLGPRGKTVLIAQGDAGPIVTKDGVTVSKSINLSHPIKKMGAALVQEAASRTNEVAGDGTTTSTIITRSMVENSCRYLAAGMDATVIRQAIEEAVRHVVESLRANARRVKTSGEIAQVATISANGDTHIGSLIAQAMDKVGRDGIITVEDAKGMQTTIDVVEGMRFDRGYLSPYFVNDHERMLASYKNARVLITDMKLNDLNDIIPLLESVVQASSKLLIIADEIEGSAIQGLVLNRSKINLPVVAVKAPGYGDHKHELLQDLCVMTGATLISARTGNTLKGASMKNLGKCKNIVVSRSTTTIVGTGSESDAISKHVDDLRSQLQDVTLDAHLAQKLRMRIANLANGVAIVKVGGTTEMEMIERKYRIEDALHATRAAADEGIVPGGGLALFRSSAGLNDLMTANESWCAGVKIVQEACLAPFKKIVENAGGSVAALIDKVPTEVEAGYDADQGDFVNMYEQGIIDPALVTRTALENAASVASTFLSLSAVVYEEETNNV